MIIVKLLISIVVLLIIPELLGLLIIKFIKNEKNNVIFAFVIGYLLEFAIAQVITVPMIFFGISFFTLLKVYSAIILILSFISLIMNMMRIKEIFLSIIEELKNIPKILALITIILIFIQMYVAVIYTHIDDDDSFYIGTALTTIQTNSLYKYSGASGSENGEHLALRYRLRSISCIFCNNFRINKYSSNNYSTYNNATYIYTNSLYDILFNCWQII